MLIVEILFWVSLAAVIYAYAGYPACLLVVGALRPRRDLPRERLPRVTIVVTVRNEAHQIVEKLENVLALDYPRELLEYVVTSDASDDGTDELVLGFGGRGVHLVATAERRGKEAAQRRALAVSTGDVLLFTDAGTRCAPGTLLAMARHFSDSAVGCVSSVDSQGENGGEGLYLRYEMWLRDLETRAGTLVGLSGSLFAVRREICALWREDMPSDFCLILQALRMGYRGVSEPGAVGVYRPAADQGREFPRKVRTVLRGMHALFAFRGLLNPCLHGLAAWELASHKLSRWLVPLFLALIFLASAVLAPGHSLYLCLLGAQAVFYALAVAGWRGWLRGVGGRVPFWFCLFNLSILAAWARFLAGERIILWEPTRR